MPLNPINQPISYEPGQWLGFFVEGNRVVPVDSI